jgi:outer membrane protein TolC
MLRFDMTLNQPLFSFGRIETSIAIAKSGVDTALANLEAAKQDMVFQANRAYWGYKASRAAVDVLSEAVEKIQQWVDKIDEELSGKNRSGYTEGDLARIKLGLAYANTQLLDQQRNLAYARDALRFLTTDENADIDDNEIELIDVDDPLPDWEARASRLRPELRLLRAADATAHSTRWARLADLMPEILFTSYLGVGYASSMDTPLNYYFNRPNYLNASIGLQLHQPLDLGVRAARFMQADRDERATKARSSQSTINYATEIAKAYEDYQEARNRAKTTARGEKISRGWFLQVDNSISSGLSTNPRELVEAAQNYFGFRLRNFQAIYDANVAFAQLRRSTGVSDKR